MRLVFLRSDAFDNYYGLDVVIRNSQAYFLNTSLNVKKKRRLVRDGTIQNSLIRVSNASRLRTLSL